MSQTVNYNNVLEYFFHLSVEDKVEMVGIMERNIAEMRRNEILDNYKDSKAETHQFSSNIPTLRQML